MKKLSILCLAAAPLAGEVVLAQQDLDVSAEPITVAGQTFPNRAAYYRSTLFRQLNARCGLPLDHAAEAWRQAPSDCSLNNTNVLPQYDPSNGIYEIPVVVHVIMNTNGQGALSDALVQSQIDILNEDFRAAAGTPGASGNDAMIQFYLADEDPQGNPTNGITRSTNNTWFNDGGSYWNTLAWDTNRYLNIYTNRAGGALGYVPNLPQGGIVGNNSDRVVVLWSAFGRNSPGGPPFDQGRTATHEVGHYFGLDHTFAGGCPSPANCYGNGDLICDTEPENNPRFGCPSNPQSCGSPDPFENYMDYTDDTCMTNFTVEQNNRMRCTIENWRPNLPRSPGGSCQAASSVNRNAGSNPQAYTAQPPVLGQDMAIDVATQGYSFATIVGFASPANTPISGGRTILVDTSNKYFQVGPFAGPSVSTTLAVPNDPSLCGVTAYTQGILFGGQPSFALTNAQDVTPGT